jgi:hypothetical protein
MAGGRAAGAREPIDRPRGAAVNTRTIAIIALIIAVVVLVLLLA